MSGPKEIGIDALKAGLRDGSMIVVDVREAVEFDAGHIPGSLFNPLSAFDVSLLPKDKTVILSCRSGNRSKTAFALAQAGGRADSCRAGARGGGAPAGSLSRACVGRLAGPGSCWRLGHCM